MSHESPQPKGRPIPIASVPTRLPSPSASKKAQFKAPF
jgi:hypothetical protein